jgi:MFS transporter, SHS family, lactate transporter
MLSEHLPAAFIPLWILPNTFSGLSAGAFCIQFGVQGAWGVVSQLVALPLCAWYRANIHGL